MRKNSFYGPLGLYFGLLMFFIILSPVLLPSAGSPKIHVDKMEYNLGKIYCGDIAEHIFVISNQGNDTLRINNVRTSCGCTAAMLNKKVLAPNEKAQLKATFDSGRFKGEVRKMISVYSNDQNSPILTLYLLAEVTVDLEVTPSQVYLMGLKAGERMERKINLKNLSSGPITIKEVSSTVPDIKIELSRMKLEPGESAELKLVLEKITPETKLSGDLTIYNTSKQKEIKIPLYGGRIN
jgi:hypothetical protein